LLLVLLLLIFLSLEDTIRPDAVSWAVH